MLITTYTHERKAQARGERCCHRCTDPAQAMLQIKLACTECVIEQWANGEDAAEVVRLV